MDSLNLLSCFYQGQVADSWYLRRVAMVTQRIYLPS